MVFISEGRNSVGTSLIVQNTAGVSTSEYLCDYRQQPRPYISAAARRTFKFLSSYDGQKSLVWGLPRVVAWWSRWKVQVTCRYDVSRNRLRSHESPKNWIPLVSFAARNLQPPTNSAWMLQLHVDIVRTYHRKISCFFAFRQIWSQHFKSNDLVAQHPHEIVEPSLPQAK